jgi:sarcosine oxidase subunit delta
MRIRCPYCGDRSNDEFTPIGDADALIQRPANGDTNAFHEYVYQRTNAAGTHRELWYHGSGCRRWLVVERDTRTHAVLSTTLAADRSGKGAAR